MPTNNSKLVTASFDFMCIFRNSIYLKKFQHFYYKKIDFFTFEHPTGVSIFNLSAKPRYLNYLFNFSFPHLFSGYKQTSWYHTIGYR